MGGCCSSEEIPPEQVDEQPETADPAKAEEPAAVEAAQPQQEDDARPAVTTDDVKVEESGGAAADSAAEGDELERSTSFVDSVGQGFTELTTRLGRAISGLSGANNQSAFVFTKPHANNAKVRALVSKTLGEKGVRIVREGDISGAAIDQKKLIDQHYFAIASKATLTPAAELPVPADKFKEKFGEEWADAKARAFNALAACETLGVDASELNRLWDASTAKAKLGGGFYCARLEPPGKQAIYTFNAFFMSMRGKFTAAGASVHWFVVEFDPERLSWADFRGKVLGPTNPADAPADSLRGMLRADWEV